MGKRKTQIKRSRTARRKARRAQAKKWPWTVMLYDSPTSRSRLRGRTGVPWFRKAEEKQKRKTRQKKRGAVKKRIRRKARRG